MGFSTHFTIETRVAQYSPYFVIEAILEVGRTRMGITFAPAGNDYFSDISYIIPIGVF